MKNSPKELEPVFIYTLMLTSIISCAIKPIIITKMTSAIKHIEPLERVSYDFLTKDLTRQY